ncbi:MAG: hypothetical protein ACFFDW_10690 [Candidatus Thorarchaeota archaeon]
MTEKEVEKIKQLEQMVSQLQLNLNVLLMSGISFLKRNNLSVEDWANYFGEITSSTWVDGLNLEQVANNIANRLVLIGAKLISIEHDKDKAKITIDEWPKISWLALAQITLSDFERYYNMWKPVARKQNLKYSWKKDGSKIILLLEK